MTTLTAIAASAALLAAVAAPAISPTPTPTPAPVPPSIAQLCLATGVDEVDNLLDRVATSDLVGELSPLTTLIVPNRDTVELDASVQLDDVRERLNCDAVNDDDPTPAPTVLPTLPPGDPDDDEDDDGFSQVDDVPAGSVDTGGGPAA